MMTPMHTGTARNPQTMARSDIPLSSFKWPYASLMALGTLSQRWGQQQGIVMHP